MRTEYIKNDNGEDIAIRVIADEDKYITTNEKNVENFNEEQRLFWRELICPKDCDQSHLRDADETEKEAWVDAHPPKYEI